MKKQLKQVFALCLIICLLVSAVPVWAAEAESTQSAAKTKMSQMASSPASSSQITTQEEIVPPDASAEVTVVREEESLRGEFEKHFLMSDGSYQAVVYSYPVHELVNGVWVELPIPEQTARGDVSPGNAQQNIIDNYVWQNHGVQDNNSVRLYIGNRSGNECRAFIRFATMPTIPEGATITGATMTVNIVSGTSTAYNAKASMVTGSWESGTIQWSNMPTVGTVLENNISHNNKTKYEFSCLAAVQHWYANSTTGQNENYGIVLQYADSTIADYNSFYSADCTDATMRPSMTISYQPLNSDIRLDVGNRVTLSVTGATGVVTWTSSDTSIATVNSFGLVTGIQIGKASITAFVDGIEYKRFTVYVTISDGVYRIQNSNGLYLGTYGGVAENTSVKLMAKATSGFNRMCQLWKISYLGDGYYAVRPMHKLDMGLHATSGDVNITTTNGSGDTLSDVFPQNRWGFTIASDGRYYINNLATSSMAMTYPNGTIFSGMSVITAVNSYTSISFQWDLQLVSDIFLYDEDWLPINSAEPIEIEMGNSCAIEEFGVRAVFSNLDNEEWRSEDESVISVHSSTGKLTANKRGNAVISVNSTVDEVTYTAYVTFASVETIYVKNLYDKTVNQNIALKNSIPTAVSFLNKVYGDEFNLRFVLDGQPVHYIDAPVDKCYYGETYHCSSRENTNCSANEYEHHKNVHRISEELHPTEDNQIVVMWSNCDSGVYCAAKEYQDEDGYTWNEHNILYNPLALVTYDDSSGERVYSRVVQILTINQHPNILKYELSDSVAMSILLAHEVAHTLGLGETYSSGDYVNAPHYYGTGSLKHNTVDCIMEAMDDNSDILRFHERVQKGDQTALCDECISLLHEEISEDVYNN